MTSHDHNHADGVPAQLHYWEVVAQELPLPQFQEMYDDAFTGLADSLNAFDRLHEANGPDLDALDDKASEVCGRAVVAAIFALGMHMRMHQAAALS